MRLDSVRPNIRVKTKRLGDTKGMLVHEKHLEARRAGSLGTVLGWVPGHGGDVWWVKHEDGRIGAYCFNEFKCASGLPFSFF